MSELKEPRRVFIKAGYYMTKARMTWPGLDNYYLEEAIGLIEQSIERLVASDGMYFMQGSETLYFLNEAAHVKANLRAGKPSDIYRIEQGRHAIGRAHNVGRLVLKSFGYRDITAEDFAEFGAGGHR